MRVRTQWTITYKRCGHTEEKDLSHKPADRREGFAQWLATNGTCTPCWREEQGLPPRTEWVDDKQEWLRRKREKEDQAAHEWAQQFNMPALSGSDKATAWAARVRHQTMRTLYTWAVEENNAPDDYELAEEAARGIDRASWWLDHRDQTDDPETTLELLHTAASTDDEARDCENPF